MAHLLKQVVVKVAERCNLKCSYCYMYEHQDKTSLQKPAYMSKETFDKVVFRLAEYCESHPGHRVSILFHGGEPLLMGAETFCEFAQTAQLVIGANLLDLSLQTNAILLNQAWIDAFQRFRVNVGVSLDGPPNAHDMFRVDHAGKQSQAKTVRGLQKLLEARLLCGVIAVVNPYCSGAGVYDYFRSLNVERLDFLLPIVNHDAIFEHYPARSSDTPVADYLIPIFDDWLAENNPAIAIRFFVDIIKWILGLKQGTEATGNGRPDYLVIESDGSIQLDDALRVCYEGSCETHLNVETTGFDGLQAATPFAYSLLEEGVPLCATCMRCSEVEVCGGGFLPSRFSRERGFDNPSVWCKDLYRIIRHIRARLAFNNLLPVNENLRNASTIPVL